MRALWNVNSASNPDGRILISWNEIGENSHIQPLRKWDNTYVNVLSQLIQPTSSLSTTYNDKNNVFVYSSGWANVLSAEAYKDSFKRTTQNGSSVRMTFTGQAFSII